jgi:cell division protein FtsA
MTEKIFALDIGTRTVVGLVAEQKDNTLRVQAMEMLEHETRSMLDGAVHDIDEVAKVVGRVKHNLQVKMNCEFKKVGIALAGRSLRTLSNRLEKEISILQEITFEQVRNLELEAVSNLLQQLGEMSDFHCVGYSVVYQELDGVRLRNLVGQRGSKIAMEVIAAFLPRSVIDSMLAVLKKVDLEPISITLEPIAAMSVIVPPDMRHLNLALVDIGAGTSDIAICRDGAVVAYGMVPEAGDEITEALCAKYLLEFSEAERLKRGAFLVEDIMGKKRKLTRKEVRAFLDHPAQTLAEHIAREIIDINGAPPQAVVCVGGGSLTPLLREKLAEALKLPKENVGIRGPEKILNLEDETGELKTPDMVTPIGIASISSGLKGLKFIHICVNNHKVQLLDLEQKLDVLAGLMAGRVDPKHIYGKPGLGISYEYRGEVFYIKGGLGHPAKILLNGREANLEDKIKSGDFIQFSPALDGEDADVRVKDLGFETTEKITVKVNDQIVEVETGQADILLNGRVVGSDDFVPDRAGIELRRKPAPPIFLSQVLKYIDINPEEFKGKKFRLLLNGQSAGFTTTLTHGAEVYIGYN